MRSGDERPRNRQRTSLGSYRRIFLRSRRLSHRARAQSNPATVQAGSLVSASARPVRDLYFTPYAQPAAAEAPCSFVTAVARERHPDPPPATASITGGATDFLDIVPHASVMPSSSPAPIADILSPVAGDMREVDAVIRDRLGSDVPLIRTVADYIIGAGGKRLRPALLLLVARALGRPSTTAQLVAAVVEFIHTATLLHDDVVDESELRRGRPTANSSFGNAASVLVGDFLYSRAFQMMVDAGRMPVQRVLADATNRIAEGEVMQLLNMHDPTVDEDRYLRVVRRKTATLFEAAGRLGAIVADADPAVEDACAAYGLALGTAFQIVDDVLDYSGRVEEIGKRVGDDLREGKVTLPLIHALGHADEADRAIVRAAIQTGGGDFERIAGIVRSCGSLDYALARAEQESALASAAVGRLPPSASQRSLLDLLSFALRRDR